MRIPFTLVLGALLLTCWSAGAQSTSSKTTKTYRWVDAEGVVHFSDSPRPGAKDPTQDEYLLTTPNVVQSRVPKSTTRRSKSSDVPQDTPPATGYQEFKIVAPGDGDTLWNIGGSLNVGVQSTPSLRDGDGVVIWLDGKQMTPQPIRSTSITLSEVYRGEHVMMAAIRSADGADMISSPSIRFVVQQSTVN
jgi:hypothetical protein